MVYLSVPPLHETQPLAVRIDGVQHEQLNYDKVSKFIVKRVSLERGATAGLVLFLAGFVYAIHLILDWVESGYKDLPTFEREFAGITLLVIGLQMIICSLYLSFISRGVEEC